MPLVNICAGVVLETFKGEHLQNKQTPIVVIVGPRPDVWQTADTKDTETENKRMTVFDVKRRRCLMNCYPILLAPRADQAALKRIARLFSSSKYALFYRNEFHLGQSPNGKS